MPPASADARNEDHVAEQDDAESPERRCLAVRVGLIGNLISQLDMLLFAETAALYYLEYNLPLVLALAKSWKQQFDFVFAG
jgi:hypothetical protein